MITYLNHIFGIGNIALLRPQKYSQDLVGLQSSKRQEKLYRASEVIFDDIGLQPNHMNYFNVGNIKSIQLNNVFLNTRAYNTFRPYALCLGNKLQIPPTHLLKFG